jgi:hypothetical protein
MLFGLLAALWGILELFAWFDWGEGLARLGLLAALALWAPGYRWLAPTTGGAPAQRRSALLVALLIAAALANAAVAAVRLREAISSARVRSDQAQTVIDAQHLLGDGINPYGTDTVIDSIGHAVAVQLLDAQASCRQSSDPVVFRVGRAAPAVVPRIDPRIDCDQIRRLFQALGFKYGPVTLLLYWPWTLALGASGVVAAHLVATAVVGVLLWKWGRGLSGSRDWANLALLVFLSSRHLAGNTLWNEHLDIAAVTAATVGWYCWSKKQFDRAAVGFGVSVATKFLPGLLFLPLLTATPARSRVLAVVIPLASLAPFAIWDAAGLALNLGYPFFRPPDSTAPIAFLPSIAATVLKLASAALIIALAWRGVRSKWAGTMPVQYLLGAHIAVLASGPTLHNNYLIWLLPLFALFVIPDGVQRRPPAAAHVMLAAPLQSG